MTDGPVAAATDPRLDKVLSLVVHELRSPLSPAAGYIRMVLTDRANPPSDMHRLLLEKAANSCGRLSEVLGELSELSHLESGKATYNRGNLVLKTVLTDAVAALPDLTDRSLAIEVSVEDSVRVHGDAVRLRSAFVSLLHAMRREIVLSDRLLVRVGTALAHDRSIRITLAEPSRIDEIAGLDAGELLTFDEWRGGLGLTLPIARCIIEAHGGRILSPAEVEDIPAEPEATPAKPEGTPAKPAKASAVVFLPAVRT